MMPRPAKKLGEKEDLEYKSKFDGSEKEWLKLIKTIVAMANKFGGIIEYEKISTKLSDFDTLVQEQIRKVLDRMNIIAAQYPSSIIEGSEFAPPMKIKPIKDKKKGIPVFIEKEKTDPNIECPYQAKDLSRIIGKSNSYTNQLLKTLKMKGDPRYSYDYKDSSGKIILRKYNDECLESLRSFVTKNPNFDPWHNHL